MKEIRSLQYLKAMRDQQRLVETTISQLSERLNIEKARKKKSPKAEEQVYEKNLSLYNRRLYE